MSDATLSLVAATAALGIGIALIARRALSSSRQQQQQQPLPQLFCWPVTTCSRRVLATLNELGMRPGEHYEMVIVPFPKGAHKSPEHLRRQPFGKVPVWREHDKEGDWILHESRPICAYLVETYGGRTTALLPREPRARAIVEQWISVEATELFAPLMKIYFERILKKMKLGLPPDESAVDEARKAVAVPLNVLNAHIKKWSYPYLCGIEFTLADLGYLPYLQALCDAGSSDLIEARPNLNAWWERIRNRAAWQQTIEMKALAVA